MAKPAQPHLSAMALMAFGLSILSFVLSFLTGIPALLVAALSSYRIQRHPDQLGGLGYARTAMTLALMGSCFSALLYLMPAALAQQDVLLARAQCARNLKDISTSMCVYGNESNDVFPLVPAPDKLNTYSAELGQNSGKKKAAEALVDVQFSNSVAGNAPAILWIMVLTQQIAPQSFICPEDSFANLQKPAAATNGAQEYFLNFQASHQLSYSVSYPWYQDPQTKKPAAAPWWRNVTDSSLPILSDMAPLDGTGKPPRDVATNQVAADTKTPNGWNKGDARVLPLAHDGEGMNVAFADAHVEWTRTPKVGQMMENILVSGETFEEKHDGNKYSYTITSPGKAPKAGEVEPAVRQSTPFDTVMVPLRDGNTGKIR